MDGRAEDVVVFRFTAVEGWGRRQQFGDAIEESGGVDGPLSRMCGDGSVGAGERCAGVCCAVP